jgi:hypothetical protein
MDATGNVRVTIKFRPSLDASEPENEADNIAFDETAGTIAVTAAAMAAAAMAAAAMAAATAAARAVASTFTSGSRPALPR